MDRLTSIDELPDHRGCGLVPTMGALHAGHLSLIEAMRRVHDHVLVTIFVNPTQFDDASDLDNYPRSIESDLAACEAAGASAAFLPPVESIYPPGERIWQPPLPDVATGPGLEDAFRPGHFAGVCQVVARFFDLTGPTHAIFGEKDWQQMRVLESMAAAHSERWGDLELLRGGTVREPDGLAMSSRNARLSPDQRERATGLSRALAVAGGGEDAMHVVLDKHGLETEYAVVRDALTLEPVEPGSDLPSRALIAARLGGIRLIDNAAC
ncbi:MAG: pantoate--beta-alanine ligase [Phycisphaerae bacterium]|nr:pantoate--beta-alanine ligase [Phycisphaerae bacterium]